MSGTKPRVKTHPESLDGTDLYAAEAIVDKKINEKGKVLFLVKWSGWAHRYNTWEPEENIASASLLSDFEERLRNKTLSKGQKRSSTSAELSTPNLLKKKSRGRPPKPSIGIKKQTSCDESADDLKSSKETKQKRNERLNSRLEKKTSVETDGIKPFEITRRLSRSSSQEQSSRSNSVNNSRRSSVVSIQERRSRRNSLIDSTGLLSSSALSSNDNKRLEIQSKSHEISSKSHTIERGMPEPNFEDINHLEIVSSDSEQSVILRPEIVPKKNIEYSDCESSSISDDSESNMDEICDKNNNRSGDPLIANRAILEPQVVLERLPKLVFKRLISKDANSDESINNTSYEISIKSGDTNDSYSVKSSESNDENETFSQTNIENQLSADNNQMVDENVVKNDDSIQSNQEKIQSNQEKIQSNEEKIESNEEKTESNEEKIESNEEKIESNEEKIESNEENIESNEEKIESNEERVESNEEKIESNEERIESNEEKIESNEERIESNEEKIESNEERIESNEEKIESNEEKIESNEEKIESNEEKIESNEEKIESNEETIESNEERIDSNEERIESNEEKIESNEETIESNEEKIESNEENIKSNEEKIESNEERVESNDERIELNEEKIESNEERIESNEERIESNEERIESNEEKIESNEEKIESNEEKIESNEEKIESNEEIVNDVIVETSELINIESIEEDIDVEQPMDTEEVGFVETIVPNNQSIDLESDTIKISAIEDTVDNSSKSLDLTVDTSTEVNKNSSIHELELIFNEDVMIETIDSKDDNRNELKTVENVESLYSPVSEVDIECYSMGSNGAQSESTQNSQISECPVNEEVIQSEELDLSKVESEVDLVLVENSIDLSNQKSIDSCEEVLNRNDETLNLSAETMNTSDTLSATEVITDEKVDEISVTVDDTSVAVETSVTVDETQRICESDFIAIVSEEELFTDSQSQDSQLSEARSTPQPRTKWTPQSDYVDKEVDQQMNYNINFTSRIESDSDNHLLPAPPSVTLAQASPHVMTPPLSSQSPIKAMAPSVEQPIHIDVTQPLTNDKSNDELQTTSAIIVDVILSPSQDSNVETQLSPTVHTNKEDDKPEDKLSPIPSTVTQIPIPSAVPEIPKSSVIMPLNVSPPPRPSKPPPPSSISRSESGVADASNWPLLSQTNHPSHPPLRSSLAFDPKSGPIHPLSAPYPYRPVIVPQKPLSNDSIRIPTPQMSPLHPQVIQRMSSRQPNLPQSQQLPHPYVHRMPSYPEQLMHRNPELMSTNCRQPSAQHFSPSMRPDTRQLQQMRTEFSQMNRPLISLADIRMRPGVPTNVQTLGPQHRHQSEIQRYQMRPSSHPNIPMGSRSQRMTSPYDQNQRQIIHYGGSPPPQFLRHLEQRLRGLPSNTSQTPYPYSNERMPFIPQSNMGAVSGQSTIRTPYTLEFQKKIVVEPKQSDIRDKLRQTRGSPNICPNPAFNPRRGPQEGGIPLETYFQRVAYNDNMSNKELEVEEILGGRFRNDDISVNSNRSQVIFGGNKSNSFNVPLNTSNTSDSNGSEILQRLLSQSSPNNQNKQIDSNIHNQIQSNYRFDSNQPEVQSEMRSISRSSSTTPKSGQKDILSEAIEEIELPVHIVFDGNDINSEDNIQLTFADEPPADEVCDNSTPEEGQFVYIYADENAGQLTNEELVELIKSQGLQVVESDLQEGQVVEPQKESSNENEISLQSNDNIVIEIDDKSLEEVQNQKAGESNNDLELQLLVIDNNESNQTNDVINVQITDDNVCDNVEEVDKSVENVPEEGIEFLVVDDNDSQSKSIPIVVQLTDNNESLDNLESVQLQLKDNSSGNETEKDSENVESVVPKEDSIAVVVEESVECVQNESSVTVEDVDNPESVPEPIQYVSMPTFCFNENNGSKSKSTEEEITDQQLTNNLETKELNDDSKEDKQTEEVEKEITNDNPIENMETEDSVKETINEDSVKEIINEENNSKELLITDINPNDSQKTVENEELVNKSVQHPVVSSSVEDFLPNSPLSSSSESVKSVAQKTVDVNNDNFLPNSPLSSSENGEQVRAPTTTIHIAVTNDNNCQNQTIAVQPIDTNPNDIEVPQNKTSDHINSSVNDENINKKPKTKIEVSKVPPKNKMSEEELREFLHLLKSRPNGFEMGWNPEKIIGINSLNSTLVFLVKWTNDKQTIILSEVANNKCPQLVIEFYEKHINWDSDTD